jgi:hypothetical protein
MYSFSNAAAASCTFPHVYGGYVFHLPLGITIEIKNTKRSMNRCGATHLETAVHNKFSLT